MDWLRWYNGTVTDPKFRVVVKKASSKVNGIRVPDVLAVWGMLLERANANEPRGSFAGFDCEAADVAFDLPEGAAGAILQALTAKGLLKDGRIANWDKRQPNREREDNSTDRVRAYRERKKQASDATCDHVTPCNAMKRHETPCNAMKHGETHTSKNLGVQTKKQEIYDVEQMPSPGTQKSLNQTNSNGYNCVTPCNAMKRHETPRGEEIREELNNRVYPPTPHGGHEQAPDLPPSPEDNPDVQPDAEISSLNDCAIEFQDLTAFYQQAGGYVDVAPAYKVYEGMRHKFPLRQIELDLEQRQHCDQWRRGMIPKLSNYLRDRVWISAIPAVRASPQCRTPRDKRQMESEQTAKRLKAAMGMGVTNAGTGIDTAAGQISHGFVQHAALCDGTEKSR